MDPISTLEQAFAAAAEVIGKVKPEQWANQSPCSEWDACGVLNHLIGGANMVEACVAGNEFDHASIAGDLGGSDPVASYKAASVAAVKAFRADPSVLGKPVKMPFGEMPGGAVAAIFILDHFGHAWDIAKATGQDTDLNPALAAGVLEQAKGIVTEGFRKPGFFDAATTAPAGACTADQLAAFLGRRV